MSLLRNRGSLAEKAAELDIPKEVIDGMTPDQIKQIIDKKNQSAEITAVFSGIENVL